MLGLKATKGQAKPQGEVAVAVGGHSPPTETPTLFIYTGTPAWVKLLPSGATHWPVFQRWLGFLTELGLSPLAAIWRPILRSDVLMNYCDSSVPPSVQQRLSGTKHQHPDIS